MHNQLKSLYPFANIFMGRGGGLIKMKLLVFALCLTCLVKGVNNRERNLKTSHE